MERSDPTAAATVQHGFRQRVLTFGLLAALLVSMLPGHAIAADVERMIVTARTSVDAAARAVVEHGGTVLEDLRPFGMLIADLPADRLGALAADPTTAGVTADTPLRVQSADTPSVTRTTVAAGDDPTAGEGVGVVLVDTGVSDHPDLAGAVVAKVDLTEDRDGVDHHGHGTFLAGLVAGSGDASDGAHVGAAPGAHLVSVKVAGADGSTTLARVLQGLVVADAARDRFDAPVVVLALSGPTGDVPDPVMIVLEMLWSRGSTVVVAAGNEGPAPGSVGSPGADPYVITAGALDDAGTPEADDDQVPAWSSRGPTAWGHTKPDLVAPGVSVVGLRVPGSTIDAENPTARVGTDYFRGSGTSMSAALTAAAAAVLISDDPALDPDLVKGRLQAGAAAAPPGADPAATGAGVLSIAGALASTAGPANGDLPPLPEPTVRPGNGHGREGAPGQWKRPQHGHAKGRAPAPAGWTWTTWAGWTWTGWTWTETDWAGWTWTDRDWSGWTWTGWTWTGWTWTGRDWAGWTWTDAGWAGWTWTGWTWTGWTWTEHGWASATWE